MKATVTTHELAPFPTAEGVFVLYRGASALHYTCAFNLRRGIHTALASGWAPDRVQVVETSGGLSLERFLRRHKWDGTRLEDMVARWEEWRSKWGTPKDGDWVEKLAPGGKLTLRCPADPVGKKVWHRLAREQTKRLMAEVDKGKQTG